MGRYRRRTLEGRPPSSVHRRDGSCLRTGLNARPPDVGDKRGTGGFSVCYVSHRNSRSGPTDIYPTPRLGVKKVDILPALLSGSEGLDKNPLPVLLRKI